MPLPGPPVLAHSSAADFAAGAGGFGFESGSASSVDVEDEVMRLSSVTAAQYRFACGGGVDEAEHALLRLGALRQHMSRAWLCNHWRWLVWSAAARLRRFPAIARPAFSFQAIIGGLAHRYNREIVQAAASPLKQVLAHDRSSALFLVLVVADTSSDGTTTESMPTCIAAVSLCVVVQQWS